MNVFTASGIVSLYREPSFSGELVTQIFFLEPLTVLDTYGKWKKVRSQIDNYEGWTQEHFLLTKSPKPEIASRPLLPVQEISLRVYARSIKIPALSPLFSYQKTPEGYTFPMTSNAAIPEDFFLQIFFTGKLLEFFKETFLGVPYLWGGRSSYGTDCSGLVQLFYFALGKVLPRDAYLQAREGVPVTFDQVKPGDLAFFSAKGKINHVGIISEKKEKQIKILHSSGTVKEDLLTPNGIMDISGKSYKLTHQLTGLRRILL